MCCKITPAPRGHVFPVFYGVPQMFPFQVLDVHQVNFKDYNILEDDQLREGIKVFSDWPTIPQVYIKGTFIGGSDILIQLHKDGEITELFDKNNIPSKFSDVLPVKEENTSWRMFV